jgi:hypothetical protein
MGLLTVSMSRFRITRANGLSISYATVREGASAPLQDHRSTHFLCVGVPASTWTRASRAPSQALAALRVLSAPASWNAVNEGLPRDNRGGGSSNPV